MTSRQPRSGVWQVSRESHAFILRATLAVVCLVILSVPASAATWVFFAKRSDSLIYLDMSTLRRSGAFRSGWTRETYLRVVQIPGTNKRADTRDTRFSLDCATGRTATGEYNFYLRGIWLDHGPATSDQFTLPANGSIEQLLVAKLCS
jgi:hypothetical protein